MRFKSYYVVWKQNPYMVGVAMGVMFKSYYVVWKLKYPNKIKKYEYRLNRTMQYGNSAAEEKEVIGFKFKSYYVVWKLHNFVVIQLWIDCLNRTMQYGNGRYSGYFSCILCCLNRTMQYGNYKIKHNEKHWRGRFKSYYVVWKQKRSSAGKAQE